MGCQTIELQTLNDNEALDLFKAHANINNSSRGLKGMPEKIVKHYGGVLVAIVAVARVLKNQSTPIWKDTLKTLEDGGVDRKLEEAYKCLKLSYDNLKNEKAKELLLISSLFPEDFEILINVLTKIGTGLGSCGENDEHHAKRSVVHAAIMQLIDCSLLLRGEEECINMHDLVHEVALWIGDKYIQSVIDSKVAINKNLRYFFWKGDDFLNELDGKELEVLLIFLDGSKDLEASDTFFIEMKRLKVLILAISEATFKHLVGIAELLFSDDWSEEMMWKNLIPDVIPIDNGGMMNDLIVLHLRHVPNIECLIETENHNYDVSAFSNLVGLHLFYIDVEDLYRGSLPSGFF
ncbi:probable disease resistance protein At5g47250 [Prosopis cineraria]|uniref:probable disease resistance protein At5g47250 n=1 Tax=Prosopis cineraria TaxID=364024 RepID=UPI00240F698E|nr:probable disease resistance protein At5g47250 [Prosopis cineraria]